MHIDDVKNWRVASRRSYSAPAAGSATRSKKRHQEIINFVFDKTKDNQRKKLKYNNRLIMFTDILKMWGFFQTELILRSNKTQLSSIEINKFMTQVNNCMFIFSEIKC